MARCSIFVHKDGTKGIRVPFPQAGIHTFDGEVKMRRKNLLFVTYNNSCFDEGVPYAIELAKTLGKKQVDLLLVQEKKGLGAKLVDLFAASAYGEAGEVDTAREILAEGGVEEAEFNEKLGKILAKAGEAAIEVTVHASGQEVQKAVKAAAGESGSVDMVVLGPSLTTSGKLSPRDINKLIKSATTPVVTIARQSACVA